MLKVTQIRSADQKLPILEQFDPHRQTWIVSDLRNKFHVQKYWIEKWGYCKDSSVLRASEFWQSCLKKIRPDIRILNPDFIHICVIEHLTQLSISSPQKSAATVLQMMDQFSALVFHESGPLLIREWLRENPHSMRKWGGWYSIAEELLLSFLKKKQLSEKWISGYLSSQTQWMELINADLVVDLGSHFSKVEAELFQNLSKKINIEILEPMIAQQSKFSYLMQPYSFLSVKEESPISTSNSCQTFRFTSQLAEVKHCTSQVRQWLEQGVAPSAIAVIVPDISSYSVLLESFFTEEGLVLDKATTVRLHSLPWVAQWLSRMRLALEKFSYGDVEQVYFSHSVEELKIRSEEFHALFSKILDSSDLHRHEDVLKLKVKVDARKSMNVFDFLKWSETFSSKESSEYFSLAAKDLLQISDHQTVMRPTSWVSLLEQVLAKRELAICENTSGIALSNVLSGDFSEWSHRIFLGLSDEQYRSNAQALISASEIEKMAADLGIYVSHPEQSSKSYELEWMSSRQSTINQYCYPSTLTDGSVTTPLPFWMSFPHSNSKSLDSPKTCRWDHALVREWSTEHLQQLYKSMDEDQLGAQQSWGDWSSKKLSLSPSSLEDYLHCPFIFASKKIFRLVDPPVVDLDLDRRVEGGLVHKMFESLTFEPRKWDWSDQELRLLIDQLRIEVNFKIGEEGLWPPMREKHLVLAKKFILFERELKNKFPSLRIAAREKEFILSLKNHSLRGKIDRIDSDSNGHLVAIDYKSRDKSEYSFTKWLSDHQIQLGLYSWVLDQGLVAGFESSQVIGALYYCYRSWTRSRGLRLAEYSGLLFESEPKGEQSMSEKEEFYKNLKELIYATEEQIDSGRFAPQPSDLKNCKTCEWRDLCRASHLNH